MKNFDFDAKVQGIFNTSFSDIKPIDWKSWLEIVSKEEYEETALKLSGLSSFENLFLRIENEKTDSRSFSVNLSSFLDVFEFKEVPIFCHTSGTTNSKLSNLKWFHMTIDIIKRQWAPGMQAIFESSGLDSKSSAVIFIPSRLKFDGIRTYEDNNYISLYSSEFSQRIMLSIIKPQSYILYEYKNSKNLEIISEILSMDKISVISAPAITVLGWADIEKFEIGLKKSLKIPNESKNPLLEKLTLKIEKKGLNTATREIQQMLSDKLSKATLIFSISSLSEKNWTLIRRFMKWKKGEERFTNLYVASEIGPFAASIEKGDFEISRSNRMHIFPLTLPIIESRGKKELISRSINKIGKLLVSRLNNSQVLINIDTGDIISIKNQDALPQIEGKILRAQFQLKYPVRISNQINIKPNYVIYAGDYFSFLDFEIIEPRNLLNNLKNHCKFMSDSLLLIRFTEKRENDWRLIIPPGISGNCSNEEKIKEIILNYTEFEDLKRAIKNENIQIQLIDEDPVEFLANREEMLNKVRNGQIPKGILKKWPLYILEPS